MPTDINPNFSVTLNIPGLSSDAFAYIQATDANTNGKYNAGIFGFDSINGQLDILNATGANADPAQPGFPDPVFNVGSDANFTNLVLSETFSDGSVANNVPLYGDATGLDQTTITDNVDGAQALYSAPFSANGPTLTSATLTGRFDAGQFPGQPVQVQVAYVPEAGTDALLLLGLGLAAAPLIRARRRAGRANS